MEIDGSQVLHILVAGTGKLRYIQRTNCSDINTNTERERESDESRRKWVWHQSCLSQYDSAALVLATRWRLHVQHYCSVHELCLHAFKVYCRCIYNHRLMKDLCVVDATAEQRLKHWQHNVVRERRDGMGRDCKRGLVSFVFNFKMQGLNAVPLI